MSSSEARQRRSSRARDRDDDVEEFEREVDTRPIFDVPEGQLLIVACGTLVFLSVIAIFLVLIFSLTGAAAEEPPPPPPPLPACFGFIDLPEGLQPRLACSTTVPGICGAPGECQTFVQLSDVFTTALLPDIFICQSTDCVNGNESCACTALDGEPLFQACVRETGQFGQTNFQCRDERQCPELEDLPETEPCQLGAPIEGLCSDPTAGCEYFVFLPDGVTRERRVCDTDLAVGCTIGTCQCRDVVCVRGGQELVICP